MADISITATAVLRGANSNLATGVIAAGVTITQGQALYDLGNGTIGLADSNGTTPRNTFLGMSLTAGSPGQPVTYVSSDSAYICGGTVVSGDTIWVSNTPGGITKTYADLASGSTVISLGVVNTDLTLTLSPVTGGVK